MDLAAAIIRRRDGERLAAEISSEIELGFRLDPSEDAFAVADPGVSR